MNKRQAGFTLIELVIVVVILGILAVQAVPKFLDLTDQAEQASVEGMAGGFATAISLARSQWEAEARVVNSNGLNSVVYDGTTLILTSEDAANGIRPGYVTGLSDGAGLGADMDDNCAEIWNGVFQQPPQITELTTVAGLNTSGMIYFANESGGNAGSTCHYYLINSLAKSSDGNFEAPEEGSTTIGNSFTYQPATSRVTIHINTL
jgi:MSHA pilin protein MshB